MTRVEFTRNLTKLLSAMYLENELPLLDYVKRSDEEQMRMFLKGLSKCDGVHNRSAHQSGKAADIYFLDPDTNILTSPKKGFEYWHNYWADLGGQPMIDWDKGHFEG